MSTDKYELIAKFARGGTAEVFIGRWRGDLEQTRLVAVKRLLPHLAQNEKVRKLFSQEARILPHLSSPNIVRAYDMAARDNDLYIVLEYVFGKDLRTLERGMRKARRKFPVFLGARIGLWLAEALEHAHAMKLPGTDKSAGLVHRDVSPQNVLLSFDGEVKLSDFGVAALTAAGPAGETSGRIGYIAPEIIKKESGPTPAADQFALGALLYEMLVGEHPFVRKTEEESLRAVAFKSPRRPSAVRVLFPHHLERIILRALEKKPEKRFPSMAEMVAELDSFLQEAEVNPKEADLARIMRSIFKREAALSIEEHLNNLEERRTSEYPPVTATELSAISADPDDPH